MIQILVEYLDFFVGHAAVWGFFFIFVFMTIESSFIPFPSEIVMIPAGFLAAWGKLTFGNIYLDVIAVLIFGVLGSLSGALINYYLSKKLGRVLLHKYGKYFFLKPAMINRAEEVFNEYGDMATLVCRLLPGIRQLISIPAGLSEMPIKPFSLYTVLGAGVWCMILSFIGVGIGYAHKDKSSEELVYMGVNLLKENLLFLVIFLVISSGIYVYIHKKIMTSK